MYKRLLSILLAIFLIMSLAACAGETTTTTTDGGTGETTTAAETTGSSSGDIENFNATGFPIVDDEITLSIFFGYSATIEDFDTNEFTLWYKDLTNINLEFILTPTDAPQRLSLMMSSASDMPDIITSGLNLTSVINYGSQGLLIPLNDLIDEYSVDLVDVMASRPHLAKLIEAPDGNIYHLPAVNECWHCEYTPKAFVAVNWMEKLGLSMPETTDDLYEFLIAIKEGDPNENGIADEIPFTGSDRWWNANVDMFLMQPFLYYPSRTGLWLENGQVYAPYTTEGWVEGILYMRKLYEEGLLDSECFVQDGTQFAQLIDSDPMRVGVFTAGWAGVVSPNGERIWEYNEVIPPITGPTGLKHARHGPNWGGGPTFAITSTCEYPEAAFRWADALYNVDTQLNMFYGLEGVGWEPAQDGDVALWGGQAKYRLLMEWGTPNNIRWEHQGIIAASMDVRGPEAMVDIPGTYPGQRRSAEKTMPYLGAEPKEYLPPLTMSIEEAEEAADLSTSINSFVEENFVRFVTGAGDVETEYDNFIAQLDNLNLARLIEINQQVYERQWKGFDFSYMGGVPGQ